MEVQEFGQHIGTKSHPFKLVLLSHKGDCAIIARSIPGRRWVIAKLYFWISGFLDFWIFGFLDFWILLLWSRI